MMKEIVTESDNKDDDDDDSHLCMKCKNIVIGIDNYVLHRKSKCGSVRNVQVRNIKLSNLAADLCLCYYSHSSVSESMRYKSTSQLIRYSPSPVHICTNIKNKISLVTIKATTQAITWHLNLYPETLLWLVVM